ncbi:uncharacterized protein LOC143040105, partial [Oratosquilla oratoria]|uniref:uncharacterized protein LOC143040105 n=1 Tax=Oratosquilla oratoria TaxID=337810 RepID=UPI003F7593ED
MLRLLEQVIVTAENWRQMRGLNPYLSECETTTFPMEPPCYSSNQENDEDMKGFNSLEIESALTYIEKAQLRWYGHIKRMDKERCPRKYLEWQPEGRQPRGRPRWIIQNIKDAIEKRGSDWWDLVLAHGPGLGYIPNAKKSVLIVKPEHFDNAKILFENSEVKVTKEGERHLGAVIGSESFKKQYIEKKVNDWVAEVRLLANFAKTESQAAYAAFIYGVKHKWNYILRTVPNITDLLGPLEEAIRNELVPVITNGRTLNEEERKLIELPPRMGGLGISNPLNLAKIEHQNSMKLTSSLTNNIVSQD